MTATYDDLLKLNIQKDLQARQWRKDLFEQAIRFATAVKQQLKPPETHFTVLDRNARICLPFELCEPVEVEGQQLVFEQLHYPNSDKFISNGALRFTIVLIFQNISTIYTTAAYCLVKIEDGTAKFAFSDQVEDDLSWYAVEEGVSEFIDMIANSLSSPHNARSEKQQIGFVRHQSNV